MSIDAHAYGVMIRRDNFEGETLFEARVRELPDLVTYGDSYDEAYELMIDAIETTGEVFAESGRTLPPPLEVPEDYSGRVTLRLPKSLHRAIALAAEAEGVSLNQHMVNVLSYFSGYCAEIPRMAHTGGWSEAPQSKPGPARLRVVSERDLQDCA